MKWKLFPLLLVLVFSVSCSNKTKNQQVNDPSPSTPITSPDGNMAIIPSENDPEVFAELPVEDFDSDKSTLTILDEQQEPIEEFEPVGSQVRLILPLDKFRPDVPENPSQGPSFDNFVFVSMPENAIDEDKWLGFAQVIINGDPLQTLSFVHSPDRSLVNIELDVLRAYIVENNLNQGDEITLDIQVFAIETLEQENDLETQQTARIGPSSLYTGLYQVNGATFKQEYAAGDYASTCGSARDGYITGGTKDVTADEYAAIEGLTLVEGNVTMSPSKMPLIFLHGWQGANRKYLDRNSVHTALCNRAEFIHRLYTYEADALAERYEFFSFGYNTLLSVESNAERLSDAIEQAFGDRAITIVGFSMGGLVTHTYIQNHPNNVEKFFALGAPLAGSHALACVGRQIGSCDNALILTSVTGNGRGRGDNPANNRLFGQIRAMERSRATEGTRNLSWQHAGWYVKIKVKDRDYITPPGSRRENVVREACTTENLAIDYQHVGPWRVMLTNVVKGSWNRYRCEAWIATNPNTFLTDLNDDISLGKYYSIAGRAQHARSRPPGYNYAVITDFSVPVGSAFLSSDFDQAINNEDFGRPEQENSRIAASGGKIELLTDDWQHGEVGGDPALRLFPGAGRRNKDIVPTFAPLLHQAWTEWDRRENIARAEISVLDASTNEPVEDVTFTWCADIGVIIDFTACALPVAEDRIVYENGAYVITSTPGNKILRISKPGYITTVVSYTAIRQETISLQRLLYVAGSEEETGSVGGAVLDSTTTAPVAGVTIELRPGINITEGDIVATAMSDAQGNYLLENIHIGNYTATLSKDGYNTATSTINVLPNVMSTQVLSISPELGTVEGELRAVLTWGESPSDLDSHLFGPLNGQDGEFHVFFSAKRYSVDGEVIAELDVDDTTSYGPETTTVYTIQPDGSYRFYVYNYSYGCNSNTMKDSDARVSVITNDGRTQDFFMPNRDGGLWHVFSFDGSEVQPVNQVLSGEECEANLQPRTSGQAPAVQSQSFMAPKR